MKRLLVALLLTLSLAVAQALELHFIDVGQGDAVLIRSSSGPNVLYDGGRAAGTVLAYLRSIGVESLDLVIASHADADHIGGLVNVIEAYRPRYYMDNGFPHTTQTYRRLLATVASAGSNYLESTARTIGLGEATLHILPPPGDARLGQNGNSVGVLIRYGEFRAALTGDATPRQFEWWSRNLTELLEPVTVYKASHHGSHDGDTPLSMDLFRPDTVVISVGAGNAYGHPADETYLLYHSATTEVYRTDVHGTVRVKVEGDGSYEFSAANEDAPSLAHLLALAQPGTRSESASDERTSDEPTRAARTSDEPRSAERASDERASAERSGGYAAVVVECILFDPDGRDDGSEVVTLRASAAADLSGWSLKDEANHRFLLPPVSLSAGESLDVRNHGRAVWNNDGDTAFLFDGAGVLVDSFSYPGRGSRACR